MTDLDIVAFRYDGEKYCRQCFQQLPPKQIKFTPVPFAVQRMSCVKNCFKCKKDLTNGQDQTRNQ